MSEHAKWGDAELGSEAAEEMASYGITCVQTSQFIYGEYRYTNLTDAIAEAKRHPDVGTNVGRSLHPIRS
jgi:hypothetical protein